MTTTDKSKTLYGMDRSYHAVYDIRYQIVFTTKHRKPLLQTEENQVFLKDVIYELAGDLRIEILNIETDIDHVRLHIKGKPDTNLVKTVNVIKGVTSRMLQSKFPEIKDQIEKDQFWNRSKLIISTGQCAPRLIEEFITAQGDRDRQT